MFSTFARICTAAGIVTFAGLASVPVQAFEPENPECIAPSNPGVGWDFICRTTAKFLFDLGQTPDTMRVTNMSGGGEAMTGLLSGATEALSGDFSEMLGFIESGDVKILAILAPERMENFADIPTAKEQGYDVVGANWRGLYMPAGASDEAKEFWKNAIMTMTEDEAFQKTLEDAAMAPFNNFGQDMYDFVAGSITDVTELSKEIGILK